MTTIREPACYRCAHFVVKSDYDPKNETGKCKAFKNGIPRAIFFRGNDHTKPFAGDGGIRFTPKTE